MKNFLIILAALIIAVAIWRVVDSYVSPPAETGASSAAWSGQFPPLDPKIQQALANAKNKGPVSFKTLLGRYEASKMLQDPWLAQYQLDYVVMIAFNNPREARKVFRDVAERTRPDSPVYPRVEQLRPTFPPGE